MNLCRFHCAASTAALVLFLVSGIVTWGRPTPAFARSQSEKTSSPPQPPLVQPGGSRHSLF